MVPSPAQVSKRPKVYSFTNAKETAARCLLGLLRSLRTKSQLEQEITTTSSESSVALSWSCSMEKLQCRHDIWLSDIMSLKPGLSQSQLSHKHERGFWWSVGKSWHGHKAKGGSIYTKKQQKKKKSPWFLTDQSWASYQWYFMAQSHWVWFSLAGHLSLAVTHWVLSPSHPNWIPPSISPYPPQLEDLWEKEADDSERGAFWPLSADEPACSKLPAAVWLSSAEMSVCMWSYKLAVEQVLVGQKSDPALDKLWTGGSFDQGLLNPAQTSTLKPTRELWMTL